MRLWIDKTKKSNHPEVWLELNVENTHAAEKYLQEKDIERRENIEKLPKDFDGFWISNPTGVIHLVSKDEK